MISGKTGFLDTDSRGKSKENFLEVFVGHLVSMNNANILYVMRLVLEQKR